MEVVKLKIRKRAVKSRGRARLHKSMLAALGAQEESKLEIVNDANNKSVTVTLYADSMVEEGYIRLGPEDLADLGLQEDDTVTIRKKPPITEQVRKEAEEAVERVSKEVERVGERAEDFTERVGEEIDKAGETAKREIEKMKKETREAADTVKGEVTKAYGRIVEETAPVTDKIEDVTKETVARIKEEVSPVTERVEGATKDVYARIVEEIPGVRERLSKAAEPLMNRLQPDEGDKLKKVLKEAKGSIRTAVVSSDVVADKLIKELELPGEVVISAVQRNQEIIIPKGETRLVKGDIVYLVGKEESICTCSEMLEG